MLTTAAARSTSGLYVHLVGAGYWIILSAWSPDSSYFANFVQGLHLAHMAPQVEHHLGPWQMVLLVEA